MFNNSNNQNPQKDSMQVATLIHETDKMSSLEIADLTGKQHSNVMRDIRNMIENVNKGGQFTSELAKHSEYHRGDRTQYKFLSERTQEEILNFALGKKDSPYLIEKSLYKDAQGKDREMYILNKKACMLLASGYDVLLRAKIIDRWEELELEKRPKITVPRKRNPSITTKVKASLLWVNGVSETLHLNDSSKLLLLKKIAEPLGLPTPDYVQSKGVLKSAGTLLKENRMGISTQVFNQKMMEAGMMENKSRPSSSGKIKHFKSIIGDGLNYGENQVNPNNPKETQPLYYEDKFPSLIKSLNI